MVVVHLKLCSLQVRKTTCSYAVLEQFPVGRSDFASPMCFYRCYLCGGTNILIHFLFLTFKVRVVQFATS